MDRQTPPVGDLDPSTSVAGVGGDDSVDEFAARPLAIRFPVNRIDGGSYDLEPVSPGFPREPP